jgi:hypothetical protein
MITRPRGSLYSWKTFLLTMAKVDARFISCVATVFSFNLVYPASNTFRFRCLQTLTLMMLGMIRIIAKAFQLSDGELLGA